MEIILQAFDAVFNPLTLMLIMVGTMFGIVCGSLPGLSSSMAIILCLPFTYSMDAVTAIVLLVTVYLGGASGGSISAILLKTPGTPEAIATTFDGYPMALCGMAGKALGLAVTASAFGAVFSAFIMLLAAPLLASAALSFQSAEYFALGLVGLACITSIGSRNQLKAVFSALVGLMVATIGLDSINGLERIAFGQPFLINGINYISVMIGTFAIAEVWKNIERYYLRETAVRTEGKISMQLMKFKDMARMWDTFLKGSILGTLIGIIPAAGGSIASLIAYGEASGRHKQEKPAFGDGNPRGIIAPESSNNAAIGGSLVPTLVLGIPGSPVAAVIMAAFLIIGLTPGPLLIREQPVMLYAIFMAMTASALLLFIGGRFVTSQFAHILRLPYPLLGSLIVVLGLVGAYSLKNSYYDVLIMFIFSLVGYFFEKFNYSSAALILGLILGNLIEVSLRRQIIVGDGSLAGFYTRPLALIIIGIAVMALLWPAGRALLVSGKARKND